MKDALPDRLDRLRHALLALHKTLVDAERVTYERTVGTIGSPGEFLQLLMHDPWFAWLRPLSQLIVAMDEALSGDEPLTAAVVAGFVGQTGEVLTVSEEGEGLPRQYFDALQREPAVVLAYGKVMAELRTRGR